MTSGWLVLTEVAANGIVGDVMDVVYRLAMGQLAMFSDSCDIPRSVYHSIPWFIWDEQLQTISKFGQSVMVQPRPPIFSLRLSMNGYDSNAPSQPRVLSAQMVEPS